ncbi:MAG TPA: hypothetical protein VIY86_06680, partial [Pirellulaceae bacterium]
RSQVQRALRDPARFGPGPRTQRNSQAVRRTSAASELPPDSPDPLPARSRKATAKKPSQPISLRWRE